METLATAAAASALMSMQLVPRHLHVSRDHRPGALSAAGGFAVAYVFLRLLPDLATRTDLGAGAEMLPFTEADGHFLALMGLAAFYGLERMARAASQRHGDSSPASSEPRVAAVMLVAFALYYALIGYLLWDRADGPLSGLVTYTLAMGVHFLSVDVGLRERHREFYASTGRWVLVGAILLGWMTGAWVTVPEAVLAGMRSLLVGGVVLITLQEELPPERDGRWLPFAGGIAAATLLLAPL